MRVRVALRKVFRNYPLLPVTIAVTLGIAAGRMGFIPFPWAATATALQLILLLPRRSRHVVVLPFFFLLGTTLYLARYEIFSENDLRVVVGEEEVLARVRGRLIETPSLREVQHGEKTTVHYTSSLRVKEIELKDGWKKADGQVATLTRGELSNRFFEGEDVEIFGVLRRPAAAQAPGLFDFREYLRVRRIFYQLTSDSEADWMILNSPKMPPVTERFRRWAKDQLARGIPEDESLRLIWAMTLGWQATLSGETSTPFLRTGTMHIFAISGLHVACIAGVLLFMFKGIGIPRHHIAVLIIPLLWFYTLATGWQSSAIRSALMSSIVILGWALKRPSALLNSIAASAFAILLWQPEQLMQTSFQLSFAVVLAMALLMPVLEQKRQELFAGDPFLIELQIPWWQKVRNHIGAKVAAAFMVSFAACCGSLPLIAYYFNMVTPVSLCANLLAVPLSSAALVCTLLSLIFPFSGPLFNWGAWVFMWSTIKVTEAFAHFPLGYFYVPKPGVWFFLLYFSVLALIFSGAWKKSSPHRWLSGATLMMGLVWFASVIPEIWTVRLCVLPVSGAPIYGDFAGIRNDFLVNCSSEREADFLVQKYLRAQGVGHLHNLLLTRGDASHAGGFFILQNAFKPRHIFTPKAQTRSPAYRRVLNALEKYQGEWMRLSRGDSAVIWKVLHPSPETKLTRAADRPLILAGEVNGWRILNLSGLGEKGVQELLERESAIMADIVITGAAAGSVRSASELVKKSKPSVVIFGPAQFQAKVSDADLKALKSNAPNVISLDREGAVTINLRKSLCEIETASGMKIELRK